MLIYQYKMEQSSSSEARGADHYYFHTDMAPCSTDYSSIHHVRLPERDIKLRKPFVEKMRRDRINSCIEQLKLILGKEFHQQDPNAKLEKADILEMTVSILRQQLQSGHSQSFSVSPKREPFYSTPPLQRLQQQQEQFHQAQRASSSSPVCSSLRTTSLQESITKDPVWRPW